MILGCSSGNLGEVGLYFLTNTMMNGDHYINVLEHHLLQMFTIYHCDYFMQDCAPCQTANKVMKWLKEHAIKELE